MMAFGPETTAEEVVAGKDLSGRIFVVTGSSAGLGAETARALGKTGATVVMVARNAEKNAKVIEHIREQFPNARLSSVTMDLADLGSVRKAAAEILAAY